MITCTLLINGNSVKVLFDLVLHILYFEYFAESLESHCMRSFDAKFLGKNPYSTNARLTHGTPSIKVYLVGNSLCFIVLPP